MSALEPGRIVRLMPGEEHLLVQQMDLSREQIDLLKRTIARGTTDDEFRLFLEACKRRRFDPFSKLIYPVKRWDSQTRTEVMALQSSIDSFRLIAERTGRYAGQVGPFWCGKDGVWRDVWLEEAPPAAARVGVLRPDFKEPLYAVALWNAYAQKKKDGTLTQFWSKMGPLMLGKCAEALALRRAFPEDLAGLVTADEMQQAETPREPEDLPGTAAPQLPEPAAPQPEKRISKSTGREIVWDSKDPNPAPTVFHNGTWEWQRMVILDTAFNVGDLGYWASWRDELLPKGKLQARCTPPTWRTAAQGQKGGGRHALLLSIVSHWLKQGRPDKEAPIEYRRAAATLAILIAEIESVPEEQTEPDMSLYETHAGDSQ